MAIFPLSWTIVHPIDDSSPLAGLSPEELQASEAEFLVLLTGFDETFAQTVHARSSYRADELVYGARTWRLCAFRQGPTTRRSRATPRRRDAGSTAQPPCAHDHEGHDLTP